MSIPQTFIQELLGRIDIADVVGRYVQLKKGGINLMGLCPFHGEKSPSFSVSPVKQFYHCFGCGVNGNAISFLMEYAGMPFIEAVNDLAQQAGMAVPQDQASPQDTQRAQQQKQQHQQLLDTLETAAQHYQHQLKLDATAIDYLKRRGLSGAIAKTFGLGYAPAGWQSLAQVVPNYSDNHFLVESGLVIESQPDDTPNSTSHKKRYDRFRDRIMFPIRNVKGQTIGFGGRILYQGEPKYLNSPETPVFSKGKELYGLFEARTAIRKAGHVLVTEGYMDVVALAQLGFAHAVATLGTACTSDHIQKIFRATDAVVFSFDGDAAGRRAAVKALMACLPFALDHRRIQFLFLPPEHDPDSFIREQGAEAFAQCIEQATPLSKFMMDMAGQQCDLKTPEGRALFSSQAKPLWLPLAESAFKQQMLQELAQCCGFDTSTLLHIWQAQPAQPSAPASMAVPISAAASPHSSAGAYQAKPYQKPWQQNPAYGGSNKGKRWSQFNSNSQKWRNAPPPDTSGVYNRTEQVLRILLQHPQAWDWISAEHLNLLITQPQPWGSVAAWLEQHWHEHGATTWTAMASDVAHTAFNAIITPLLQGVLVEKTPDGEAGAMSSDWEAELTDLLQRMLIDQLMAQETLALSSAATNPELLQNYRTLHAKRIQLTQSLRPPAKDKPV